MQDKIFYSSCFGFIFGVLLRSFVFVNLYLVIWFGVVALLVILFFCIVKNFGMGLIISCLILFFSLGILRFDMVDKPNPEFFESQVGGKVTLSGEIVDQPDITENNQKLTVLVAPSTTKILVTVPFGEEFKYGDEINFKGILQKPENFITDQGKEFDYINYLRKDGIYYVMNYVTAEIVSRDNGNFVKSILFSFKKKFLRNIDLNIANPENLLMGGLILGEKAAFSSELRNNFINTGTIHIVALSGYNVTIVAEWFMKFLSFSKIFSLSASIGAGIFLVWLFILMTGFGSTAIRAGIMATLTLFARATGRNYDVARALVLAGVFMILINPFVLVFDVSFQLSFLATIAVIFLTPRIEKYFLWVPKNFALREIASVTFSAYVFVTPFILYKMGNLSLVALPANFLILPFIPFTMLLGFLTGFAGLFWYGFSVPLGFISYLFLHYELGVIDFFSKLSFASIVFPDFPLIFVILIYVYFFYILFWRSIQNS